MGQLRAPYRAVVVERGRKRVSRPSEWRDKAAPVIINVVNQVGKGDPKALRRALRQAYPFGERRGWPYRAWLIEIHERVGPLQDRSRTRHAGQMRLL